MSKILSLSSSNIKRLSAVEISPDGNVVIIGGNNAQGKTSVLDSIWYALGGSSSLPEKPLRKGQKKGKIVLTLDDYIVTRTFTESGGGVLKVENKEGAVYKAPQNILNALCGKLGFDPLQFVNSDPKKQLEDLMDLVGLDFTNIDERRKEAYEKRTIVGREGKEILARLEACQVFENVPDQPVSSSELMQELQRREAHNSNKHELFLDIESYKTCVAKVNEEITKAKSDIEQAEKELAYKKQRLESLNEDLPKAEKRVTEAQTAFDAMPESDVEEIRQQIACADETNEKIRSNAKHAELKSLRETKVSEYESLTETIKKCEADKKEQLSKAEFPIDGLSFDESGVIYNEIPLSQASQAEKLRVGVAIAAAMNPKLRIMLIRDASLIDENGMKILKEMADEKDIQIWMERVGKGSECGWIIEDGMVEGAEDGAGTEAG